LPADEMRVQILRLAEAMKENDHDDRA